MINLNYKKILNKDLLSALSNFKRLGRYDLLLYILKFYYCNIFYKIKNFIYTPSSKKNYLIIYEKNDLFHKLSNITQFMRKNMEIKLENKETKYVKLKNYLFIQEESLTNQLHFDDIPEQFKDDLSNSIANSNVFGHL
jgi:hypothetical protein